MDTSVILGFGFSFSLALILFVIGYILNSIPRTACYVLSAMISFFLGVLFPVLDQTYFFFGFVFLMFGFFALMMGLMSAYQLWQYSHLDDWEKQKMMED